MSHDIPGTTGFSTGMEGKQTSSHYAITQWHSLFIDLRDDNDTFLATSTTSQLVGLDSQSHIPSLQSLSASPLPRKRGRPKGSAKPVIYGPTRRRGQPPGTGRNQKQILLGQEGLGGVLPVRHRGRLKKQVSPPAVSIELGKVVSQNVISVPIYLLTFC